MIPLLAVDGCQTALSSVELMKFFQSRKMPVAVILNVESPTAVGFPESRPDVGLRLIPAGSAPEDTDHVGVPPVAVNWKLYAAPNCAGGRLLWRWTMLRPWTIVIWNSRSVDSSSLHQLTAPLSSCIEIQKSHIPACVGVPEISPSDDKDRPGGSALLSIRNLTYGVQPVPSRPFN